MQFEKLSKIANKRFWQ